VLIDNYNVLQEGNKGHIGATNERLQTPAFGLLPSQINVFGNVEFLLRIFILEPLNLFLSLL